MFINAGMGTLYVENIFDNNAINIRPAVSNKNIVVLEEIEIFLKDNVLFLIHI